MDLPGTGRAAGLSGTGHRFREGIESEPHRFPNLAQWPIHATERAREGQPSKPIRRFRRWQSREKLRAGSHTFGINAHLRSKLEQIRK